MPRPTPPQGGAKIARESTRLFQVELLKYKRDVPNATYVDMAQLTGRSVPWCRTQYLKALREITREPAEEVLKMELMRLDELQTEVIKVLRAFHVVVSQGQVIHDRLYDAAGNLVLDEKGDPIVARLEDHAPKLAAVDRALKIMERRAKLLGLDAVPRVEKEGMTHEEVAAKIFSTVKAMEKVSGAQPALFPPATDSEDA